MFISIARPAVEPTGPDAVAVPGSPAIAELSPRAMHARLLANAALRRMRGIPAAGTACETVMCNLFCCDNFWSFPDVQDARCTC